MKLVDADATILVVTGAGPGAVEKDGPLARWLAAEVDQRGGGIAYHRAVVLPDTEYLRSPMLHGNPTIAVGGPGTNQVAQHMSPLLPMVWNRGDQSFVQMAPDRAGRQVALWGMTAEATRDAVEAFVEQGMLDELLERFWRFAQ